MYVYNMLVRTDVKRKKTCIKGLLLVETVLHVKMLSEEFHIKSCITCHTKKVIYLLVSMPQNLCRKNIPPIKNKNLSRWISHQTCWYLLSCCSPLRESNHSVSQLKFVGMEKVIQPHRGGNLERLLLQCEVDWIFTLNAYVSC